MPTTDIAGAAFTVTVGATNYSAQVTSGTISRTGNTTRTKVLGPATITTQTDTEDSISLDILYDEDGGLYDALVTASAALTSVAVVVVGGTLTWTFSAAYVSALSAEFAADGVATCSMTLDGAFTVATSA